jgi:hypothetical protein
MIACAGRFRRIAGESLCLICQGDQQMRIHRMTDGQSVPQFVAIAGIRRRTRHKRPIFRQEPVALNEWYYLIGDFYPLKCTRLHPCVCP